jgi:hypothetical protein
LTTSVVPVLTVRQFSKNTCADLMKGERLHDVVGRSYDIEVRVYQNRENNALRARRLAAQKAAEAAEKANKSIAGTKRAHEEASTGNSTDNVSTAQKSAKRQKTKASTHRKPGASTVTAAATDDSSLTDNVARPLKFSGISSAGDASGSTQASASGGRLSKRKSTKRGLNDEEELEEHVAPPRKKTKSNSHPIAPTNKSSAAVTAKSTASARGADDRDSRLGQTRKLRPRAAV